MDHAWFRWDDLPAGVEPPELTAVVASLDPTGPWALSRSPAGGRDG